MQKRKCAGNMIKMKACSVGAPHTILWSWSFAVASGYIKLAMLMAVRSVMTSVGRGRVRWRNGTDSQDKPYTLISHTRQAIQRWQKYISTCTVAPHHGRSYFSIHRFSRVTLPPPGSTLPPPGFLFDHGASRKCGGPDRSELSRGSSVVLSSTSKL